MNEKNQVQETEIDILQLVTALVKRWWIILLCAVVCAIGSFGYTKLFVTPTYQSSAMLYVNNKISVGNISINDLYASQSLVGTYRVILTSRLTLEEVLEQEGLTDKYTYNQLRSMISTDTVEDTEIFSVTVTSPDPEEACRIANRIVRVLPDQISGIVIGSTVTTVDYAVVSRSPSSPSYSKNVLIGFLVGFLLGGIGVAIAFFLNDAIQSEDWIRQTFGEDLPLLSVIPDVDVAKSGRYGYRNRYYGYSRYGYYYAQSDSKSVENK